MHDLAVFNMAAGLHDLEPADLAQRTRGPNDGALDRVLKAFFRRACDLDNSIRSAGYGKQRNVREG